MNFVQLCEELIVETELLEEASNLLPNDSGIRKLAQEEMKEFVDNKGVIRAEDTNEYKAWREEQLRWRNELQRRIERVLNLVLTRSNRPPRILSWQELDNHINDLRMTNESLYEEPFKLLHSDNLGAENRERLGIPVS